MTGFGTEYDRIGAGRLASSTDARLQELTGWGGYSSFLSPGDLAIAADADVVPVAQVVGFAAGAMRMGVVRTTRPGQRRRRIGTARWREHSGPVQTWAGLRRRALGRLEQQAEALGANAVVGVRAQRRLEERDERSVAGWELRGTAVRIGSLRAAKPLLTLASPSELWSLLRAGQAPVGIAGGFASVQTLLSRSSMAAGTPWARRPNAELGDLTEGAYEARRLAMSRLVADARALGAGGVVGVELELEHGMGHLLSAHVLGTAVRRVRPRGAAPAPVLTLGGARRA